MVAFFRKGVQVKNRCIVLHLINVNCVDIAEFGSYLSLLKRNTSATLCKEELDVSRLTAVD